MGPSRTFYRLFNGFFTDCTFVKTLHGQCARRGANRRRRRAAFAGHNTKTRALALSGRNASADGPKGKTGEIARFRLLGAIPHPRQRLPAPRTARALALALTRALARSNTLAR